VTYGSTRVLTDRVSQPDVTLDGIGAAFDVWVGRTPWLGVTLGPALTLTTHRSGSAHVGGQSAVTGSAVVGGVGAFVDAYPRPSGGLHFGGLLALASLHETTDDGSQSTDFDGGGALLMLFAGYDAWVARSWSLGGMVRCGGIVTRANQTLDGESFVKRGTSYDVSVLLTALYY
jgi:hypothetical protein